MSDLPKTQKALFIESAKGAWIVGPHPVHIPAAGEVLVRVEAAGLNPVDWKVHDYDFMVDKYPAIIGSDGSGVIVALGESTDSKFKVGDRVLISGSRSNRNATFQQYLIALTGATAKIPASITFDQGATIASGIRTVGVRFYTASSAEAAGGIGLTAPWNGGRGKYTGEPILILGGSSAVGQAAIQLAALSGLSPIITTVSPRNNDFVKDLGATHALDRNQDAATLTASVRSILGGTTLRYVLDAVSLPETQTFGYRILADAEGGSLILDLPDVIPAEDKEKGKKVEILNPFANNHPAFLKELNAQLPQLLESGDFKPHRVEYIPGGLGAIPDALDRLRKDQVSGAKLIVRPQETA